VRLVMTYIWKFGVPAAPAAAGPAARAPGLRLTVGPSLLELLRAALEEGGVGCSRGVCLLKRCSCLHAHDRSWRMMCF